MSYLVYAVDSADRLTLIGPPLVDGVPTLTRVALSFINAPKIARRTSMGEFSPEDPCAGDAVEFVRNLCIGKPVKFTEDYKIDVLDRRAGRVTLANGDDLTSVILQNGFASLPEHAPARADKALLSKYAVLEREARAAKKGIFDPSASRRVRCLADLTDAESAKLAEQLKGKEVLVRVEQVLLPSVLIASAECFGASQVAVHMPGITVKDADCMAIATEARFHTERFLLHRKVKILFEGLDSFGNVLGSVTSAKGNFQTELLSRGLVKLNGTTLSFTSCAEQMQAAEKEAKAKHVGVWKTEEGKTNGVVQANNKSADSGNPGLQTTNHDGSAGSEYKGPLNFNAVVIQIINGDTISVRSDETGEAIRISLAGVRSSKNVTRDQDGRAPEARVTYSEYEWEAREFLRKRLIGKRVAVRVEFARQIAETKEVRPVAIVTVPETGENIGVSLLETGYVNFFLGQKEICSAAALLQGGSDRARAACVGQYSKAPSPSVKIVELNRLGSARGKYYLSFLQRGMQGNRIPVIKGVVDFVLGGSSLRVYIPREHFQIPVKVAGIISPMGAVPGSTEKPDEYADESKRFAVDILQQREVEIQVHTADKAGNFISTVTIADGGKNYAVAAVEAGLATVANADRLPYLQQLIDAEGRAQTAKKCIWSDGAKIPQRALKLESERNASSMHALKRVDAAHSVFSPYTLSEVGEDGVSVYIKACSDEAEDQRAELQTLIDRVANMGGECNPKRDELVVAQYSEDKSWNRARVIQVQKGSGTLNVHFIDFGNTTEVRAKDVRKIPIGSEFAKLRDVPALAVLARLAFLRTKVTVDTYTRYACDTIYDYTDGDVIAREMYRDASGGRYFTVTVNENVPSLSETLLQKGMAVLDRRTQTIDPTEYKRHEAAQDIARRGHKGMWRYGDIDDDSDDE